MRALLLAAAVVASGCAHLEHAESVCEQYRGIRCLGSPVCDYDKTRGCAVCRCPQLNVVQPAPSGSPPPVGGVALPEADRAAGTVGGQ